MDPLEAQAPQTTETTTEPKAPEAQNPQSKTAQDQHNELDALLANPEWTPETAEKPVAPEPVFEVETTEEETPAGEQPQAESETEVETETEGEAETEDEPLPKGIERPRFKDPQDQVVVALKKLHPDWTFAECEAVAKGVPAQAEPEAQVEPEAQTSQVATLRTQLVELDAKIAEAKPDDGTVTPEFEKLTQQRGELLTEIKIEERFEQRDARQREQAQQTEVVKTQTAQAEAAAQARADFPAVQTNGSALNVEAKRLMAELEGSALMKRPSAPVEIVEMAALNVARAEAAKNKTSIEAEFAKLKPSAAPRVEAQKPKPVPVVKPKPAPVASGAQATLTPDKPASEADRLAEASKITDPREQQAAYNRILYGK